MCLFLGMAGTMTRSEPGLEPPKEHQSYQLRSTQPERGPWPAPGESCQEILQRGNHRTPTALRLTTRHPYAQQLQTIPDFQTKAGRAPVQP